MTEDQELAITAIVEFGYTLEEDGSLVKYKADRPREKYVPEGDGFLRFTRDDGVWRPIAFQIAESFKGVSGLDFDKHPECFDFVYPAEYLLNIYSSAVRGE